MAYTEKHKLFIESLKIWSEDEEKYRVCTKVLLNIHALISLSVCWKFMATTCTRGMSTTKQLYVSVIALASDSQTTIYYSFRRGEEREEGDGCL